MHSLLRAVPTLDFMTPQEAHLPHSLLGKVSKRIINEVRGINPGRWQHRLTSV